MDLELRVAALEKKVKELELLLDHALDRKKTSEPQYSDIPAPLDEH